MNATTRVKILLVDDHPMIRAGLSAIIANEPTFELVGEAQNGTQAIQRTRDLRPDVAMMDLKMPDVGGIEAIKQIRAFNLSTQFVIFTTFHGEEDIYRGLQAGAKGYLLKDAFPEEIVNCIKTVSAGRKFIPHQVAATLAERMDFDELSARELEILRHLSSGKSNKTIGRSAGIGEGTVKFHVNNILSKLGAQSRTEAVILGARRGLIPMP